jgi:hypothetical protein
MKLTKAVNGDTKPTVNDDILNNLGTIEVVVLRCEDDPDCTPIDPWKFPQLPTLAKTTKRPISVSVPAKQSKQQKKKATSAAVADGAADDIWGGMLSIFDGAADEPPQIRTVHFGSLDGRYNADGRSMPVLRSHQDSHKHAYLEVEDDTTQTSSNDHQYFPPRIPGAYYEDDDAVAYDSRPHKSRPRYRHHDTRYHPSNHERYPAKHSEPRRHDEPRVREEQTVYGRPRNTVPTQYTTHDKVHYMSTLPRQHEVKRAVLKTKEPGNTSFIERDDWRSDDERQYKNLSAEAVYGSEQKPWPDTVSVPDFPGEESQSQIKLEIEAAADTYNNQQREYSAERNFAYPAVNVPKSYKHVVTMDGTQGVQQQEHNGYPYLHQLPAGYDKHQNVLIYPPPPQTATAYVAALSHIKPTTTSWHQPSPRKVSEIQELEWKLQQLKAETTQPPQQPMSIGLGPSLPWQVALAPPNDFHQQVPMQHPITAMYPPTVQLPLSGQWNTQSAFAQSTPWQYWNDNILHMPRRKNARSPSPGWDSATTASGSKAGHQNGGDNKSTAGWGDTTQGNDTGGWGAGNNQGNDTGGWGVGNDQSNSNQQNGDNSWGTSDNKDDSNQQSGNDNAWLNSGNNDTSNNDGRGWGNGEDGDNKNSTNDNNNWDKGSNFGNREQNDNSWDNKDDEKKSSKSKKKLPQGNKPSSAGSKSDEIPYTRSYWHLQIQDNDGRADANSSRKRDKYTMPEDPIYTISEDKAKSKHLKHQVRGGKGAEQEKRTYRPIYWDSLKEPYAVFRFKYRSRGKTTPLLFTHSINTVYLCQ